MARFNESDHRLLTRGSFFGLLVILAVGLICRAILVTQTPAFTVDIDSYFSTAYGFVTNGTFILDFKRAPVYPLFLTGVMAARGLSFEAVAVVQHALGLMGVVLVYLLGALVFSRATGLLAALGVALSGAVLQMEHTVGSEIMFALLLLGSLLCTLLACRRLARSTGVYLTRWTGLLLLLAGVLIGLLALTRPSGQMVLALAAAALLLSRGAWQSRALAVGLLGLGYSLVMGPWLMRNYATHGVATAAGGLGDSLYSRIRRHDLSFDLRDHGTPVGDARRAEVRAATFELAAEHRSAEILRQKLRERLELTEAESDEAVKDLALVVIRQEPLRYLGGTLEMFVRLGLDQGTEHTLGRIWDRRAELRDLRELLPRKLRNRLAVDPPPLDRQVLIENLLTFNLDRRLGPIVVLLFALGATRCTQGASGRAAVILPLVVVTHLLVHVALDGPLTRYRYVVQPLITLTAAGGLTWLASVLVRHIRQWTRSRVVANLGLPVGERRAEIASIRRPAPPA